jgi:Tfp pilus assembly protein FimT
MITNGPPLHQAARESTTMCRRGDCGCVFAIVVPFAIAMAIILSSIMTSVSEKQATESHRLVEREAIWGVPVMMDNLRQWKRSMGTVGSGKLKLEAVYENGDVQVVFVIVILKNTGKEVSVTLFPHVAFRPYTVYTHPTGSLFTVC